MKTIAVFCVLVAAAIAGPVKDFDRKAHIEGRITGGAVAAPHQFPYQIGLLVKTDVGYGRVETDWCGGSLISNRVVLTAAHCLDGAYEADVELGSQGMLTTNIGSSEMKVSNDSFVIHPEFNADEKINDIALIILPVEMDLNEYIQPVNLPRPDEVQSTLEGTVAVLTGWGSVGDNKDMSWDNLLYVNLRILPGTDCEQAYQSTFYPTQMCVSGDNKKSACAGDSGGPLVISESDGSRTVVGLVSYGSTAGCELGMPIVFTRITSYLDWIAKSAGAALK